MATPDGHRRIRILPGLVALALAVGILGGPQKLGAQETGHGVMLASPTGETRELLLRDAQAVEASERPLWHRKPVFYIALAPGVIIALVLVLRRRRGESTLIGMVVLLGLGLGVETRQIVDDGVAAFLEKEHQASAGYFAEAEQRMGGNPALAYNQALCQIALGRRALAVSSLYRAIALAPDTTEFRETLRWIERGYGLEQQIPPGIPLHPNTSFLVVLVLANAVLVAFGLMLSLRRGSMTILFVLTSLALSAAILLTLHAQRSRSRPLYVVSAQESPLKRAPLENAQPWITLPEGATVLTRGRTGEHVLVQTGLGVEGWIESSLLISPFDIVAGEAGSESS